MAINYEEIERALATMTTRSRLYAIVKKEMQLRGHWKYHGRGKPVIGNLNGVGEKIQPAGKLDHPKDLDRINIKE